MLWSLLLILMTLMELWPHRLILLLLIGCWLIFLRVRLHHCFYCLRVLASWMLIVFQVWLMVRDCKFYVFANIKLGTTLFCHDNTLINFFIIIQLLVFFILVIVVVVLICAMSTLMVLWCLISLCLLLILCFFGSHTFLFYRHKVKVWATIVYNRMNGWYFI